MLGSENHLNICQVALARDFSIVKENIKEFNKYYSNVNFFIVCPSTDLKIFCKLKKSNIFIINEDSIISYKKFYRSVKKNLQKSNYNKKIYNRLRWYYQQVLKISFVIIFFFKKKKILLYGMQIQLFLKKLFFLKMIFLLNME